MVGPFIGWAIGVMLPPGWPTFVGGTLVLAATIVVTLATSQREGQQSTQQSRRVALVELWRGARGHGPGAAGSPRAGPPDLDVDELQDLERMGLLAGEDEGSALPELGEASFAWMAREGSAARLEEIRTSRSAS